MKSLAAFISLRPRFFAFCCAAALITLAVTVLTYQQTGALLLALAWGFGVGVGALGCVLALRISLLIRPIIAESAEVWAEFERVRARFALMERRMARMSVRLEIEDDPDDSPPRS